MHIALVTKSLCMEWMGHCWSQHTKEFSTNPIPTLPPLQNHSVWNEQVWILTWKYSWLNYFLSSYITLLQTLSVWNVWVWTLTWRRVHLPTSPLPLRQRWWSLLPPWMSAHLHYQPHSHRLPGTSVQWAPSSEMNGTWKKIALRKCHFNKLIANDYSE